MVGILVLARGTAGILFGLCRIHGHGSVFQQKLRIPVYACLDKYAACKAEFQQRA
jgi:hypothetical protein